MIRLKKIQEDAYAEGKKAVLSRVREIIGVNTSLFAHPDDSLRQLELLVRPLARVATPRGLDGTIVRPALPIPMLANIDCRYNWDGFRMRLIWYGADPMMDSVYEETFLPRMLPGSAVGPILLESIRRGLIELFLKQTEGFVADVARELLRRFTPR